MKTRPSDYLNTVQLLNQLVEEAAELASAASKMIRIIDGANPTPGNTGSRLEKAA